jgi:hypothetical protein
MIMECVAYCDLLVDELLMRVTVAYHYSLPEC